jgi:peptidoglycan/LPS O-acetylase OafA/YrhL
MTTQFTAAAPLFPATARVTVAGAPAAGLPEKLREGLASQEIPTLNGLRAIAVLFVILNHAGLPAPGGFGVLTFFTLSGFLITWLLLKEHRRTGAISLRTFYLRRTLRIFPAYYAYAALLIGLLLLLHKQINLPQALASLFYVNNYYQAIAGDPNTGFSHTWSLAVEEQFYLVWAPAILVLLRYKKVLPALCTAIVAVWIYRLVLVSIGVNQGYIYEAFDTRADHLLVGCLLAWVLFEGKWAGLFRLACRPWAAALIVLLLAVLNVLELRLGTGFRDTVAFTVEPALVALLIPGLIHASGSVAWRILQSAPVSGIGRISYSMYLYQQLLIGPVEKVFASQPVPVRALAIVLATIAAGLCSYHLVEKPFLRLKDRLQPAASRATLVAR